MCLFPGSLSYHHFPFFKTIDNLGLKGRTVGGARVSEKHANFIVNLGWATSADVLELIEAVRSAVLAARQISLELEIEVW